MAVDYDPSKVRVLQGRVTQKPLASAISPEARARLADMGKYIVLPPDELAAAEPVKPYWDATLQGNRRLRRDFVKRLHKVGLIRMRRRVKSHVGLFSVRKSNGQLRMVVDARLTNAMHRRPPHTSLATPGSLVGVNMSDEWAQLSELLESLGMDIADLVRSEDLLLGVPTVERASAGVPTTVFASGAGIDLVDGFFQFEDEQLACWFSLGEVFTAEEMGVTSVFDDDLGHFVDVSGDEELWACMGALGAGWSWAMYFAHDALVERAKAARASAGLFRQLVLNRTPTPLFH